MAESLKTTRIWPTKEYIQRRHDTVAAQVAYKTINELCTGDKWMSGTSKFMWRWDQNVGREV